MADYDSELLSYPSAFLIAPLPHLHERAILDPSAPSSVRVLGKSMHAMAAGWTLAIGWLWVETLLQHFRRHDAPPPNYAIETVFGAVVPAIAMALIGWGIARVAGRAPYPRLERKEWWHAFWWSVFPNLMLLATVWVLIQDAR